MYAHICSHTYAYKCVHLHACPRHHKNVTASTKIHHIDVLSMYVCACIYMYIYIYTHIYIHTYTYANIYTIMTASYLSASFFKSVSTRVHTNVEGHTRVCFRFNGTCEPSSAMQNEI
jgi:hypothetical protein